MPHSTSARKACTCLGAPKSSEQNLIQCDQVHCCRVSQHGSEWRPNRFNSLRSWSNLFELHGEFLIGNHQLPSIPTCTCHKLRSIEPNSCPESRHASKWPMPMMFLSRWPRDEIRSGFATNLSGANGQLVDWLTSSGFYRWNWDPTLGWQLVKHSACPSWRCSLHWISFLSVRNWLAVSTPYEKCAIINQPTMPNNWETHGEIEVIKTTN